MNILYIDIADLVRHIPMELRNMGHKVTEFCGFSFGAEYDEVLLKQKLENLILESSGAFDAIISFNFFHVISEVSFEFRLIYISWIYDSPQAELFHPSLANKNNAIFVFDKMLLKRLENYQPEANLYYLPLAGNISQLANIIITDEDEQAYARNITFIGSLYENNVYNQTWSGFSQEQKDEMADYLMKALCHWEGQREWPRLTAELIEFYRSRSQRSIELAYDMPLEQYFGCMVLSRKLSEMERATVLNRLSERIPICIYTNSRSHFLDTIQGEIRPPVDYRSDMPKIFHLSRINLNITLPSIETGIPLRVFDILSVGGFCLTNWQEEVGELFEVGKEIEVYRELEELYDKADFYLRNEDARLRIAIGGYQAIKERHDYRRRLKGMLSEAEGIRERLEWD